MIYDYKNFYEILNEGKNNINRNELHLGDSVLTIGDFDNVNLDYRIGKIISMREYGYILIEFEESFDKKLHAGNNNIGKNKHCFYIPIDNIKTNDKEKIIKILKNIKDEDKNRIDRLREEYEFGDIIIGVGKTEGPPFSVDLDEQIGVIYYKINNNGLNQKDRYLKNNATYWVGFSNIFHKNMRRDNYNYPMNGAGLSVDKIHMRRLKNEDYDIYKEDIETLKNDIKNLKNDYKAGDIITCVGMYNGVNINGWIGIIMEIRNNYNIPIFNTYGIKFIKRYNQMLYNINNLLTDSSGYWLYKNSFRKSFEEEIKDNEEIIKNLKIEIDDLYYEYKIGDKVIIKETDEYDGNIGVIVEISNISSYNTSYVVQFKDKLIGTRKIKNYDNCLNNLYRRNFILPRYIDVNEIEKKLENKEVLIFKMSGSLKMLLKRMEIKINNFYSTNSYIDITNNNDMISYLPLDKFKRLNDNEDPYKSRLRQVMKIGKFLRTILNKDVSEREVEKYVNSYKSSYDICISGLSDKLKLVSGEDIRFWYCEDQYVKGGGMLNSSCMRYKNKGPEMQMFVDNPDVIQLLILLNEDNKLLGRALIWKLVEPDGKTFMDYVYARYDKDNELFWMFAEQRDWLYADNRKNILPNMICELNTDKKYTMGKNALDHFDTLGYFNTQKNYLSNKSNTLWEGKKKVELNAGDIKKENPEEDIIFKDGDKILYKKKNAINDGKYGKFYGTRNDGKYKIIFDDGVKFAAARKNIYPAE